MPVEKMGYQEIAELDMEDVRDLGDVELPGHFRAIAERATAAQLRAFLFESPISETAIDDDPDEKADLEAEYVDRRCAVVRRLRKSASAFDGVIEMINGKDEDGVSD